MKTCRCCYYCVCKPDGEREKECGVSEQTGQRSRVSLSPTLGAGRGVNYLLPFAGCLCWAELQRVVPSWAVESGALRSSPSFAIYTTLRDCKQRANLFTPVSLCVKSGLNMVSHSKGCWENYTREERQRAIPGQPPEKQLRR